MKVILPTSNEERWLAQKLTIEKVSSEGQNRFLAHNENVIINVHESGVKKKFKLPNTSLFQHLIYANTTFHIQVRFWGTAKCRLTNEIWTCNSSHIYKKFLARLWFELFISSAI